MSDTAIRPAGGAVRTPRLAEGVELVGEYQDSAFEEPKFLVMRADGQAMQLPELLYRVVGSLDGRTPDEIAAALNAEYAEKLDDQLTGEDITFVVEERLRPVGLIEPDSADPLAHDAVPSPPPDLLKSDPLLALRHRAGVIPAQLALRLSGIAAPLFRRQVWPVLLAAFVVVDAWIVLQGDFLVRATAGVRSMFQAPALFLAVLGIMVAATAIHEWGHIAACRYGGATPGDVGVGLFIIWPAFYSSVTDSYRLDRRGRLRTDLGGVYFDAVVMTVMGLLYLQTGEPWLLVALVGMHTETAVQLLPSVRLDGYYILADLVGVPDLFGYVKASLLSLVPGRATHPMIRELKPRARRMVVVWVAVTVPLLAAVAVSFLFSAPTLVPAAWDEAGAYLQRLRVTARSGDVVLTMLGVSQLALSSLAWIGTILLLLSLLAQICRWIAARLGLPAVSGHVRSVVRTSVRAAVLVGLGTAVVVRVAAVAATHPATADETRLVGSALGVVHGAADAPAVAPGELLVRQQLVWYARLTGAFGRHGNVISAGRELAVVATTVLVVALLVLVASRHLRPLAAGLALVVVFVMGPAVTTLATVGPGVVGAAWAAAGASVLTVGRGRLAAVVGVLAITLGVLTEPVIVVPVAVGIAVVWGVGRPAPGKASVPKHAGLEPDGTDPGRWLALAIVVSLGGLLAFTATNPADLPLTGAERAILLLAGACVVGIGLRVPRLRLWAVATAAALLAAVPPWAGAGAALPVALAAMAVLGALIVDDVVRRPVAERPHPLLRIVVVAPVLVLVVVGALFMPREAPPSAHAQLATWLQGADGPAGTVAVPADIWGDLLRDGVPAGRLVRNDEAAAARAAWTVVDGPGARPGDAADTVVGQGAGALVVRPSDHARAQAQAQASDRKKAADAQLLADAARRADAEKERFTREVAGQLLLQNSRFSASPELRSALEQGAVDPRMIAVTGQLTAQHTVKFGFPSADAAPPSELASAVLITAVDGWAASRSDVATFLGDQLRGQDPAVAPAQVVPGPEGVLVTWSADPVTPPNG